MTDRVEDFSAEKEAARPGVAGDVASDPAVRKVYDPSPERESIRGKIAMQLMWLMGGVLAALALLAGYKVMPVDEVLMLVGALLTPVVGLFGAVMGFYFGEKSANAAAGSAPPPGP